MKNYLITSSEYDIVTRRILRLNERKTNLENQMTSCTSKLKDVVVLSGFSNDKMVNYVAEIEEIENEILELEEEASKLKEDLDFMDSRISNINEIKEQVFVMFFIQGIEPKRIAPKIPCDISTVYKKIREINQDREMAKKNHKLGSIL